MHGTRTQYTSKVDVFSFGIVLGELLSWRVSYSAGVPGLGPKDLDLSSDGPGDGFMALVNLRQSVIDGLRPTEMAQSPDRRETGFAELGTWRVLFFPPPPFPQRPVHPAVVALAPPQHTPVCGLPKVAGKCAVLLRSPPHVVGARPLLL